nr:MAG TPA: MCSS domain [Bacteriophage sp.]
MLYYVYKLIRELYTIKIYRTAYNSCFIRKKSLLRQICFTYAVFIIYSVCIPIWFKGLFCFSRRCKHGRY